MFKKDIRIQISACDYVNDGRLNKVKQKIKLLIKVSRNDIKYILYIYCFS